MAKPFPGKAGWRTVVLQDETAMVLDPSLPPPWWPNQPYQAGDLVVNEHRFYRCRAPITWSGDFQDEPNRAAWVDITGGHTDIRDMTPDAVGTANGPITAPILPNRRLYVDTRNGPVNVTLPPLGKWANGDIIEIVDDYRTFDQHPCTLVANGIRINFVDPNPDGQPGDAVLAVVGTQDYWRFTYYINPSNPADQWLYILSAPTGGGSAAKARVERDTGAPDKTSNIAIKPGMVLVVDNSNGPLTFNQPERFKDGDTFRLVDSKGVFGKHPVTIRTSPTTTQVINQGSGGHYLDLLWLGDSFLLPGTASAAKGAPVVVTGPYDGLAMPNTIMIAKATNGSIVLTPDDSFADGDSLLVIDYDWSFDKQPAILKPTNKVIYQDAREDGTFTMDTVGPTAGWAFTYYDGLMVADNAPLDEQWIQSVTNALNGGDDEPRQALFSAAPGVGNFPTFTTVPTEADIDQAAPWMQYDCTLGRKRSMTINLPPVADVPARSRIRVRMMSTGQGIVNVQPRDDDQILGLFGTLNATPKGKPRTVHGQYNMIELESDGQHEWMVV